MQNKNVHLNTDAHFCKIIESRPKLCAHKKTKTSGGLTPDVIYAHTTDAWNFIFLVYMCPEIH